MKILRDIPNLVGYTEENHDKYYHSLCDRDPKRNVT
jgi:hypothetical protein